MHTRILSNGVRGRNDPSPYSIHFFLQCVFTLTLSAHKIEFARFLPLIP